MSRFAFNSWFAEESAFQRILQIKVAAKGFNLFSLDKDFQILKVLQIGKQTIMHAFQDKELCTCIALEVPSEFIGEIEVKIQTRVMVYA
jgi:hypothetical protein